MTADLRSGDIEDAFPLTSLQQGMIFHSLYAPGSSEYHDIVTVEVASAFDEATFTSGLVAAAHRHPALRTAIDLTSLSEPVQLVHRAAEIPLVIEDLSVLSGDEQRAALAAFYAAEATRELVLDTPPLLRAFVHVLGPTAWQLSLSFHHAILDGWSVTVLLEELLDPSGPRPSIPPWPMRDYVEAERASMADERCSAWWADFVASAEPCTLLRSRAGGPDRVDTVPVAVSPATYVAVQAAAASLGVSAKSVLLAAHVRVLADFSGMASVTTGLVTHGRFAVEGGESVLGLFLNSLPFHLGVAGTWRTLVRAVVDVEREVYQWRRLPLHQIQQTVERDSLFDTLFNFTDYHRLRRSVAAEMIRDRRYIERTNYPLVVYAAWGAEASDVHLTVAFDRREIAPDYAQAYADRLAEMLGRLSADLDGDVWDAPPTSRQAPPRTGRDPDLAAAFRLTASHHTDRTALRSAERSISYGELDGWSDAVASLLADHHVGRGSRVGLVAHRRAETVVGMLAILKRGAAYVPLDPTVPVERLHRQLSIAGADIVVGALPGIETPQVAVEDVPAGERRDPVVEEIHPEDAAYVMFTSGTTGDPKGVVVTHANVKSMLRGTRSLIRPMADDVWSVVHSFAFDFSVWELFGALLHGGCAVILDRETVTASDELWRAIVAERVTVLSQTPGAFRELARAAVDEGGRGNALRTVVFGGEALLAHHVDDWAATFGLASPTLVNMYGITEITVHATAHTVEPGDLRTARSTIGRALGTLRVDVAGLHGELLPDGVPGEITVAGEGVVRGYVGAPAATADRFRPDPAGGGGRLYRSGDLGRRGPDGELEYLGRRDAQVKVRGHRIELGDVRAGICRLPDVEDAAVVAVTGEHTSLVCFAVVADPEAVSADDLRQRSALVLPTYMVPASFVVVPSLLRTANGKVDTAALLAQHPRQRRPKSAPPSSAMEAAIARIFADVLGLDDVGVDEDFFELGGHSLLALRAVMQVRSEVGSSLPVGTLFTAPTVRLLAEAVAAPSAETDVVVPFRAAGRGLPLFCVHPFGGHVICYQHLARLLPESHPFYGVRARGLEGEAEPFTRIEEMALHYVDRLRRRHPSGPVHLAGWCMGGQVAYEMARILRAEDAVASLTILSSSVVDTMPRRLRESDTELMAYVLAQHVEIETDDLADLPEDEALIAVMERARLADGLRPGVETLEQARRLLNVYRAHRAAVLAFDVRGYDGDITVLRTDENHLPDTPRGDLGWERATSGSVRVVGIPGDHYSLLVPPNVHAVARLLGEVMLSR